MQPFISHTFINDFYHFVESFLYDLISTFTLAIIYKSSRIANIKFHTRATAFE